MTDKIEISRELIERIVKDGAVSMAQIDQMRQTLAAPVVERQEPAAEIEPIQHDDWAIDHSAGRPVLVYKKCSVIEDEDAYYLLSLIEKDREPPAPVAVVLPARKPEMDGWPYSWNACIDKVKELNS